MLVHITKECPDCGVNIGDYHKKGCDVARCPECGGQEIACNCVDILAITGMKYRKTRWMGIWPGILDCIAMGKYTLQPPATRNVSIGEVEANLNALGMRGTTWNKIKQMWVLNEK